jgi:hypothetical protein
MTPEKPESREERKRRKTERFLKRLDREREIKPFYDKLYEARSLAKDMGLSTKRMMLAVRDVFQEPVPEADEEE